MLLSMRMLLPVLLPMLRNHNLLSGFFTASASPCTSPLPSPISVLPCLAEGGDTILLAPMFLHFSACRLAWCVTAYYWSVSHRVH